MTATPYTWPRKISALRRTVASSALQSEQLKFRSRPLNQLNRRERIFPWGFIQRQGMLEGPLEIYGAMEFLRMLDQFFERAICFGAEGYERASVERMDCVLASRPPSAEAKRM
jgi:hypothetical protein